jgi:hypothetical protein
MSVILCVPAYAYTHVHPRHLYKVVNQSTYHSVWKIAGNI